MLPRGATSATGARWGNFANQELYGPPTGAAWGIAIQCQNRVAAYARPPGSDPLATTALFIRHRSSFGVPAPQPAD